MFYEEKVVNGRLCSRTSPTGDWVELQTPRGRAVNALAALSQDDRDAVLGHFCRACNQLHPSTGNCVCWNDE
jgi:hypothetical protein